MAAIDNNNERGVAIMLDNFKDFARMPVFDQDKSLIQDSGLFLPENELVCCRYWRFMYPAENTTIHNSGNPQTETSCEHL